MKKKVLIVAAGAAVLAAGVAVAQADKGAERMFQRLDTNGDGQITQAAADAFRADRFRSMDVNADGR